MRALDPAGDRIQLNTTDISALALTPEPAKGIFHDWSNAEVFRITSMGNECAARAHRHRWCRYKHLLPGVVALSLSTRSKPRRGRHRKCFPHSQSGAHVDPRAGGWGSSSMVERC